MNSMDLETAKIHIENNYNVIEFNQGHYTPFYISNAD
jgi:hypothetical protein